MEKKYKFTNWNNKNFFITNGVFLPRESTIIMLNEIKLLLPSLSNKIPIIDLCCGIGAIGISALLDNKDKIEFFYGFDNDLESVKVCNQNIKYHKIQGNAYFWEAGEKLPTMKKGLVVCNPPFLSEESSYAKSFAKKSLVSSKNNGLDVILKCFQSLKETDHILILKSFTSQVPKIIKTVNADFKILKETKLEVEKDYIISFTTWRKK